MINQENINKQSLLNTSSLNQEQQEEKLTKVEQEIESLQTKLKDLEKNKKKLLQIKAQQEGKNAASRPPFNQIAKLPTAADTWAAIRVVRKYLNISTQDAKEVRIVEEHIQGLPTDVIISDEILQFWRKSVEYSQPEYTSSDTLVRWLHKLHEHLEGDDKEHLYFKEFLPQNMKRLLGEDILPITEPGDTISCATQGSDGLTPDSVQSPEVITSHIGEKEVEGQAATGQSQPVANHIGDSPPKPGHSEEPAAAVAIKKEEAAAGAGHATSSGPATVVDGNRPEDGDNKSPSPPAESEEKDDPEEKDDQGNPVNKKQKV